MDPISIVVTALALYGLATRSPQWLGELADEWRAARRGKESPAAAARRQRLIDNGIDPASGGPMRQYVGNRWRDYWLDADAKATKRRADRLDKEAAGEVLSWRERMQSRMDDEVTRRAERQRTRPAAGPAAPADPSAFPGPASASPAGGGPSAGGATAPRQRTTAGDSDHTDPPTSTVHDDDTYTPKPPPTAPPASGPTTTAPPGPIRVDATVGEPIRDTNQPPTAAPSAITAGGTMSNALAPTAVTGVVSGAAEARAIQTALEQATEEYVAALTRARNRIMALGEQSLATVQMSGRSHVVANTAAAAEAAAAATAGARACTAEVVPLLGNVARAFDRLNS